MVQLRATWRLQLRNGVDLAAATAMVPHLARLGVSHLYLSPVTAARPGSTHGYDAVDPNAVDPDLGGRPALQRLAATLRRHGMGILLDIVPNHLGTGPGNAWWNDLLRHGRQSGYAEFFDVDWRGLAGAGSERVLLPVLGSSLAETLAAGELRVVREGDPPRPWIAYHAQRFPLSDPTPDTTSPADLASLLDRQHWRLASWRAGSSGLNWRRFFDVTELVGIRVERPEVFEAAHGLVLELVALGVVDAVRVDHVDGLAAPGAYLDRLARRLAEAAGRPVPILVEKILGEGEDVPIDWPIAGTTGYEVLNDLTGLFVDPDGLPALDALMADHAVPDFAATLAAAKRHILEHVLAGELERLAVEVTHLARSTPAGRDLMPAALRQGLAAVLSGLDVYRLYHDADGRLDAEGTARLDAAIARVRAERAVDDPAVLAFLRAVLLGAVEGAAALATRAQQLSGPLMAKAMEDTAFYRWPRLLAANEVGGHPDDPAVAPPAFHERARARLASRPDSLVATATHDTKRGEDTRLRIAAISENAAEWADLVRRQWTAVDALRETQPGGAAPSDDFVLAFLQTLVGIAPFEGLAEPSDELVLRLLQWAQKATREAKHRTSWLAPDDAYEAATVAFVRGALDPRRSKALLDAVGRFAQKVAPVAAVHSLAQALLKVTVPGVPDIYQGTELWDSSLVDPDNRRPVDFDSLANGFDPDADPAAQLSGWTDGRIKQAVLARALRLRAERPGLFAVGAYVPLPSTGVHAQRVVAFARIDGGDAAVIVAPRLVMPLMGTATIPLPPPEAWEDTELVLPRELAGLRLLDRLDRAGSPSEPGALLPLRTLLARLPVALLATVEG